MKIEFLLSFKNHKDTLELDSEFLKIVSENFTKNYSKKTKKKNIKPILKCNLLKNIKLQNDKNKTEYKANLLINKLSKDNFEEIIKEFIITFLEIEQDDFDIILEKIFTKMIKDDKFIGLFFKFYNKIYTIYNNLFDLSNQHLIDLIEQKIKFDYNSLKLEEDYKFIENLDSEENRINGLRLVILLLESNNLNKDIINIISNYLVGSKYIPDIYFWFSNKYIINNTNLECYYDRLKNKLTDDINNRYIILLKNLLDNNNIEYDNIEYNEESESETEPDNESVCNLENSTEKSEFEIEIDNILEEYMLLEEFDEVLMFIEPFKHDNATIKLFMNYLLDFYFNSSLTNLNKFKNLFINLKRTKIIKSDIFKQSLSELLCNSDSYDYMNLSTKIEKLIDIYKIIEVKVNKDFIKSLNCPVIAI